MSPTFVATFLFLTILPNMVWAQISLANLTCYFPFTYDGQNYTTCITTGYGFSWCSLTPMFRGYLLDCRQSISQPCSSNPCLNSGTCVLVGRSGYACLCPSRFTGLNCDTVISTCYSRPCSNTGTCLALQAGNYTCLCAPGFTGVNCETISSVCDSKPCLNNGTCIQSSVGMFRCLCPSLYTGTYCGTLMNPCYSNPCSSNGVCLNMISGFQCQCATGFEGVSCQSLVNPCSSNPCVTSNTISCQTSNKSINNFICVCHPNFTGIRCETICLINTTCSTVTLEYQTMTTPDIDITIVSKSSDSNTAAIVSSAVSGGSSIIVIICVFFYCRRRKKQSQISIKTQSSTLQTSETQQQPAYARALYDWVLSSAGSGSPALSSVSRAHTYDEIGSVYAPQYLAPTLSNEKTAI